MIAEGYEGTCMKLSTLSIDHLGLVAGFFDELGISEVIDEAMPRLASAS